MMGSLSLADGAGLTTIPLDICEDGRLILVTADSFDGLVLINQETGTFTQILKIADSLLR
jgi:hypothetical protein